MTRGSNSTCRGNQGPPMKELIFLLKDRFEIQKVGLKPHLSGAVISKRLKITTAAVQRAWNTVKDLEYWDPNPILELNWALGRPLKLPTLKPGQYKDATSPT
jgi:hypothetical protein